MNENTITSLFEKQVKTALDKLLSVAVAEICHIFHNISDGTHLSASLCDRTQSVMERHMRISSEKFLNEHVEVPESLHQEEYVGIQTEDESNGVSAVNPTSDSNYMLEADLSLPITYEAAAVKLHVVNLRQDEDEDDKTKLFPEPTIVSCTSLIDDNNILAENNIFHGYILSPVPKCILSKKQQVETQGPLAGQHIVDPVHESTPKKTPPTIECPNVQTKVATQSKQRSVDDTDKESDNYAYPKYEPPVLRSRRGSSSLKPDTFEKGGTVSGMEAKCKPTQSASYLPTQVSGHLEYAPLTSAEHDGDGISNGVPISSPVRQRLRGRSPTKEGGDCCTPCRTNRLVLGKRPSGLSEPTPMKHDTFKKKRPNNNSSLPDLELITDHSTVSLGDHHDDNNNILTHSSVLPSVPTVTAPHLNSHVSPEPIGPTVSTDVFEQSEATACVWRRSTLPPGPVKPATPEHPSDLKLCSVRLEVSPRLRRLAKRRGRSRLLVCGECGKTFGQKRKLRRHQRFHTGERPHGCGHCGRSFILRSTLKCHRRVHTGEKPYRCERCGKTFRSAPRLASHTRFHTGEKPYGCPACDRRFRVKGNLKKHALTHAVGKLVCCLT